MAVTSITSKNHAKSADTFGLQPLKKNCVNDAGNECSNCGFISLTTYYFTAQGDKSLTVDSLNRYSNGEIGLMVGLSRAKMLKTPMSVSNPLQIPEYEVNPAELSFPQGAETSKGSYQLAKWNGTRVVVKILNKDYYSDPESIKRFKNELTLLQKVRHPHVVQFVGAVTQNVPMMIIAEYLPNGDLKQLPPKERTFTTCKGSENCS